MNIWKKIKSNWKKIFLKSREEKKRPHCENCYNSIDFFENPEKMGKTTNENIVKTKSMHVHHYTPWFSITETVTDDENTEIVSNNQNGKQINSYPGIKVFHHKHYTSKKIKNKRRKSRINDLKIKQISDFVIDDEETYDNCSINAYSKPKNCSVFYIRMSPFQTCFNPNFMRKL